MPKYYVYIMKSLQDASYYKGFSTDYIKRFHEHNYGRTRYSNNRRPWELIYVEAHSNKREALIREKKFKRCKAEYFEWLRTQVSNILL